MLDCLGVLDDFVLDDYSYVYEDGGAGPTLRITIIGCDLDWNRCTHIVIIHLSISTEQLCKFAIQLKQDTILETPALQNN